jgi:hypothetical protein
MSVIKQAFIAKELLNFPDCVSQIMKVLQLDFLAFQKLCLNFQIKIESERDRLTRHDLAKIKQPLIERLNEINSIQQSKINPIYFNGKYKNNNPTISHGPIFDQMANQKNKLKFISVPMRD